MADLPTSPNNREEQYLASIAGQNVEVPECPWSRKEAYLDAINGRVESLQDELEELENNPDVADIVDTYADLEAYDTSTLTDKDIIRVLNDETHDGDSTYYRYSTATGEFTYIGTTKQYTDFVGTDGTTAGTAGLVPAPVATDAGKFLKADGTWDDAGSSVNVVQTTGTSTTDVMSQNAVTGMVYADPSVRRKIRIGRGPDGVGNDSITIQPNGLYLSGPTGEGAISIGRSTGTGITNASAVNSIAIGTRASAISDGAIALGNDSSASAQGEMNIGSARTDYGYNNSNYRLLSGVYDGQSAHDAATKGQLDSVVLTNAGAPTTSTVGAIGQLLEDTTNGKLYQCTAIDNTDPQNIVYTWTEVGGGSGGGITALTTADYNYPTTGTKTGIAVWLLTPGAYILDNSTGSTDLRLHTGTTEYVVYTPGKFGVLFVSKATGTSPVGFEYMYSLNKAWLIGVSDPNGSVSGIIHQAPSPLLASRAVVDNLTSAFVANPLSAKQGKVLNDKIGGDLSNLTTTDKASLIAAINELVTRVAALEGN